MSNYSDEQLQKMLTEMILATAEKAAAHIDRRGGTIYADEIRHHFGIYGSPQCALLKPYPPSEKLELSL